MNLKRRILLSILMSLGFSVAVGGAFATVMVQLQGALNSGSKFITLQQAASEALAVCFSELQYVAIKHLRDYDDSVGNEFANKAADCSESIEAQAGKGMLSSQQAKDFKDAMGRFKKEVLEISGQQRIVATALDGVREKVSVLTQGPLRHKKGGKALPVEDLAGVGLLLTASVAGHRALDKKQLSSLLGRIKERAGKLDGKTGDTLDDFVLEVEVAADAWNRSLNAREAMLMETSKAFSRIPVAMTDSALRRMTVEIEAPMNLARASLLGALALLPVVILVGLALARWILASWARSMGSLKAIGASIINNDGQSVALATELKEASKAGDEASVAIEAMLQTFKELEDLKKSLEKKVQDRTKALKQTQNQLFQSEKLAGLGTLAAGVAHELNNPLQVIQLAAEGARTTPSEEKRKTYIEQCLAQVNRMSRIIAQLRRIARKSDGEQEWAPLAKLYENIIVLHEGRINNEGIKLEAEFPRDLELRCEPVQMESLVSNLISNAIDAVVMKEGAEGEERRVAVRMKKEGQGLIITIEDNGVGIPDEHRNRIFEPFFTSKDVGKGMGLGLSLSHSIAQEHQIAMSVDSKVGQGTKFTLKVPARRVRTVGAAAA